VVAAGSLLEFTLADHSFSMPVGRISYLYLGPLTFGEFLKAADPELDGFYSGWTIGDDLPESRHQMLLKRQREYLVVGGMPEAVQTWLESRLFGEVQRVQRGILDTYVDDFSKYARQVQLVRLQRVFRAVPAHLGRKIKFSNLSPSDRSAEVKAAVDLLCKARVCSYVLHSDCSGLPLGAGQDATVFKLLFLDVGLVSLQLGLDWSLIQAVDERTLLNEGSLAEQFVGQELLGRHGGLQAPELQYWLREGRSNNAELDFVIQLGNGILPIEVKAGKSGTLKSLYQFVAEKHPPRALRFDLNPPSRQVLQVGEVESELFSLPLYFAGRTMELLRKGGDL
jgi:predicted AAA+ superfamily ATPase